MESPQMIINRNYIIQPYDDYDETYIGTLIKTSSIRPKYYQHKFNNLTKLERQRNGSFIPTRINGTKIFRTGDYFELLDLHFELLDLQEDMDEGRKRKRKKSKSKKRKSRKRKSV